MSTAKRAPAPGSSWTTCAKKRGWTPGRSPATSGRSRPTQRWPPRSPLPAATPGGAPRGGGARAHAGLGILSAARLYDLDFLPVCQEQYDLLIPDSAWDTPMVKMLLEVMESEAFARRLQRLGGYTLEKPGQVRLRL